MLEAVAVRHSNGRYIYAETLRQVGLAGQKIVEQVEQAKFFQESKRTGIYLTCQKLREVDTSRLLDIMLAESRSQFHHTE